MNKHIMLKAGDIIHRTYSESTETSIYHVISVSHSSCILTIMHFNVGKMTEFYQNSKQSLDFLSASKTTRHVTHMTINK